ncbi:MAG: aspartate--tRNA ligase [SAR324 cluster bacterium]|nr:aspartate--tRNA ligase [SAR324 cluster bacterium]
MTEHAKITGLRSHRCGELRPGHIGSEVVMMGWVATRRDHGGVIFVDLRDHTGLLQVVFKPEVNAEAHRAGDALRNEYVIAVAGKVAHREEGNVNPKLDTGEVEILVERLDILNPSRPPLYGWDEDVDERLRMKHRYFDLRRETMQHNLRLRSRAANLVRNYLLERDFVDIETPVLTRATPEGARDYLVPSRINPGSFYALPQSPQIFKQLLMVGGFDRYFQVVKCFRDEDLRGNRQPEFTQIDLEMAFTQPEEVFALVDGLMARLFSECIGVEVPLPIPRITYSQAMEEYGSDAPDLRFGLKLVDLSEIVRGADFKVFADAVAAGGQVKGIRVPGGGALSRKDLDDLTEFVMVFGAKGMAWVKRQNQGWQSPIAKFFSDAEREAMEARLELAEGDLAVFCADSHKVVAAALGNLRGELARRLNLTKQDEFEFVWVTDFPLLEYDEQAKRHTAKHHPFTSPVLADLEAHGDSDPLAIRARAYDITLNGVELGGGSIRIHQAELQKRVFDLLGLSEQEAQNKFGFLLEAFTHGAPPHGGIALGFDRIMMFLVGTQSIRDVIAFPKTQRAADLMMEAPAGVDEQQLRELGIRLRRD